ncbi:FKBP-type peptidyl-prolyl cis-trans isomerase [Adhaeribacter sp. BT258]|uniref:Peptidyl-prolyl cis-trans isomerase n=1 Tax=Adhaeribacter terrigena TaxID=2793070 RepID=A0ABS1C589_9BACT|nr:FKBP-type peptidyl-prolyl cis-trans isomerase [Adhaeribacter terrigena]MBK0404535.1 FKBP-type peptidyl-prolyl cis-trans isomerase [Adhaeribacter terrigena]
MSVLFKTPIFTLKAFLFRPLFLLAFICSVAACQKEVLNVHDPVKQAADDEVLIKEWMARDSTMRQAKRTESGIYYATLQPGTGAQVKHGNTVKVHYIGRFLNGSKFDSSYDKNSPFTLTVGKTGVITGWTKGLQLMTEGETMRFYIPSGQAYGPRGSSGSIPPNAVLVFDINVLQIVN